MRLGIIGLPNSGKTTIFNALTGGNYATSAVSSGQFEVHTAIVNVPDIRVDQLAEMYNPKKITYATVTYVDIGGLDKGISEGGLKGQFRNELGQVDGFLHILRAFESTVVPHPHGTIDPQRDLETLDSEFLLADLVSVENRIERLESELRLKGKKADKAYADELPLMQQLKAHLEAGQPLRDLDLTDEQIKSLRGYGLLTLKPVLVVLNMGDTPIDVAQIIRYKHRHTEVVGLQGALEAELSQLEPDDAAMFMEEYGISELSASRVIRLSYKLLNLHSFLTAGDKEVRAWSIPVGATAYDAAGAIHTEIQKGFIRAEVMTYDDLIAAGSEAAVKAAGKMRLESKDYIVKDGDILVIRHSS
jgi:hypothetical protein